MRIHFDGLDNIERKIGRDDVTFMHIVALMETQGYGIMDSIYCRKGEGMELVESNRKIYELLDYFEHTKILNLIVKRGRPAVPKEKLHVNKIATKAGGSLVRYADPVVYDMSPPPVYVVDNEGSVIASQTGFYNTNPYVSTQESTNWAAEKGKAIEEPVVQDVSSGDEAADAMEEAEFDGYFSMGEAEFDAMEAMRSKEEAEFAEIFEERRKLREDPVLHCEGDTDIEDLFVTEDNSALVVEPVPACEPEKNKRKKRKGPTLRSHSSVPVEQYVDYIPSTDEDRDPGFLSDSDDDCFQPLSMVPPKGGRKSRAKKMKPRMWYDDRRRNPHEQLCLKMCFINAQQFRDALISLHIAQSRNYAYHRNSNVRVTVHCIHESCPFHMVASEIKGEKTVCIRKMVLQHTCNTSTETSRVSAKWLAENYEGMFRSDPHTNIQSLIDLALKEYGIEVPKMMAYRAKNLALDAVLGDHRRQYHRLRDFAQTVIDTNPGSRVTVATVTPVPTFENPHPGPTFHGLFFCINGPREGFLKGCRPFIGELAFLLVFYSC